MLERVADERVALAERHAVAEHHPQQGNHRHENQAVHHRREDVLAPHQSAVEKYQPRRGHHQHQRRAGEHPGIVAVVDDRHDAGGGRLLQLRRDRRARRGFGGKRRSAEAGRQCEQETSQDDRFGETGDWNHAACLSGAGNNVNTSQHFDNFCRKFANKCSTEGAASIVNDASRHLPQETR